MRICVSIAETQGKVQRSELSVVNSARCSVLLLPDATVHGTTAVDRKLLPSVGTFSSIVAYIIELCWPVRNSLDQIALIGA